ncbi:hypothetical protein [Levilactobacillus phage ENFP1]|nr:hypothetical protein [Levilactobacillus phage ENFP1]
MGKTISLEEVNSIIDSEIEWSSNHKKMVSPEYYEGYIKGLEQVKLLLEKD